MPRRSSSSGAYVVTGPYEDDHPVPSPGAGMSCAQTFAARHSHVEDVLTYYVRNIQGDSVAVITKHHDGVITTTEGRPS